MMVCWHPQFPDVAGELASRGAEVILLPIWGGNENERVLWPWLGDLRSRIGREAQARTAPSE